MPDTGSESNVAADARTSPSAVWRLLESMKGEELAAWRIADVPGRASAEERNLTEPFPMGWYSVGYSDELAVGEVKPLRYLGKELVMWRGEDGGAHVLDAYCRHLGAHMGHGGKVHGNNLECPFHAWRYDGTGAVKDIPYAKIIPPQAKRADCVPSWHTMERNGMIWIWYHPKGTAPLWEGDVFPEVGSEGWTSLKKFQWRVFNSVKNMHDNGVDVAHFLYVHRTAAFPESDIEFDGHRFKATARAKLGTPKGMVEGAIVSNGTSPGQGCVRFLGISETLLLSSVTPVDKDELHVRFAFTQPQKEADGPMGGLARALIRDICKQLDQDKIIWDRLRYEPKPLLCDGDGPIPMAREHYNQFLSDEEFERLKGKKRTVSTRPKVADAS